MDVEFDDPWPAHGRARRRHSRCAGARPGAVRGRVLPYPRRRSSAPSRCSGRAATPVRDALAPPVCAARRRCSTCGTRLRARSSRSRDGGRDRRHATVAAAPIQVVQRIFTEPPFVVAGLEPMTLDQMADAVRAAGTPASPTSSSTADSRPRSAPPTTGQRPRPAGATPSGRVSAGQASRSRERGLDVGDVDGAPPGGLGAVEIGGEVVEVEDLGRGDTEHAASSTHRSPVRACGARPRTSRQPRRTA